MYGLIKLASKDSSDDRKRLILGGRKDGPFREKPSRGRRLETIDLINLDLVGKKDKYGNRVVLGEGLKKGEHPQWRYLDDFDVPEEMWYKSTDEIRDFLNERYQAETYNTKTYQEHKEKQLENELRINELEQRRAERLEIERKHAERLARIEDAKKPAGTTNTPSAFEPGQNVVPSPEPFVQKTKEPMESPLKQALRSMSGHIERHPALTIGALTTAGVGLGTMGYLANRDKNKWEE